ncbi:MAG: hypothetical protein HOC20_12410 [Chloroflexi bacterium]|mgnify:CR=1 FL=1|nr:hypothetical protein [Chloroflexota bacterium]
MYMYIGIEISSWCNAKCPWCFTTKPADRVNFNPVANVMSLDTFIDVIERLETLGLLHDDVVINLYEIGEPFLNRDISRIISYLNSKSLKYAISTNASVLPSFEEGTNILSNLSYLIISMPGFSQESYDRVHGFRFDRIKKNIIGLITNFRNSGFIGDARLIYHVYQLNIDEIYKAKAFADENHIDFYPYYAILYEWKYVWEYLSDTLSYDLLKKASEELFLGNIEKTISARRPDFVCEFLNMLLIDVDCDLKTCCQIKKGDPGYSYGSIFNLSAEEIITKRTTQQICKKCQTKGMDYYLSCYTLFNLHSSTAGQSENGHTHKDLLKLIRGSAGQEIILFGAGEFGIKAVRYLNDENIGVNYFSDNSPLKIGKQISGVNVIAPWDILNQCTDPLVIITTINHRQVFNQISQLGIRSVYYFPLEVYIQQ